MELSNLTLDELGELFECAHTTDQWHNRGLILLEARDRFKGDIAFGRWCRNHPVICKLHVNHRTQIMNTSRWFKNKPKDGIRTTVARIIAQPRHSGISEQLYGYAAGRDLTIDQLNSYIRQLRGVPEKPQIVINDDTYQQYKDTIVPLLEGLTKEECERILKSVIQYIRRTRD
jgi:hypothetical protein